MHCVAVPPLIGALAVKKSTTALETARSKTGSLINRSAESLSKTWMRNYEPYPSKRNFDLKILNLLEISGRAISPILCLSTILRLKDHML